MKSAFVILGLLLAPVWIAPVFAQTPGTQCITTAVAGGTGDALTIPKLPCVPTTTMLILTITNSNNTSTPTLTPVGGITQTIVANNGAALTAGILTPGSRVLFTNSGSNWIILNVTNAVINPDQFKVGWTDTVLTGIYSYLNNIARFPVGAIQKGPSHNNAGVFGSARTSDQTTVPGPCCSISLASFTYNDNAAIPQAAWGTYNTSVREPGTGPMLGTEWDIGNLGDTAIVDLYSEGGNLTVPVWSACGGELNFTSLRDGLRPCSASVAVVWNGQPFDKGIVVYQSALVPHDGEGWAINLPIHGMVRWEYPGNITASFVDSQINDPALANGLMFTNFGAIFETPGGVIQGVVDFIPNSVNFPRMVPAPSGQGVVFQSDGSDNNVDLILQAKSMVSPGGAIVAHNAFRLMSAPLYLNLPACNSGMEGDMLGVTDSNTATFNAVMAGGGSNHVIAYCNGSNWTVH